MVEEGPTVNASDAGACVTVTTPYPGTPRPAAVMKVWPGPFDRSSPPVSTVATD